MARKRPSGRRVLKHVDIQDSHGVENLIQAPFLIGVLNVRGSFDLEGPPVGADGIASARQEERSGPEWRGQPAVRRGGAMGRPYWLALARSTRDLRQSEQRVRSLFALVDGRRVGSAFRCHGE